MADAPQDPQPPLAAPTNIPQAPNNLGASLPPAITQGSPRPASNPGDEVLTKMKKLPSDYPEYIDPATGKFKKGYTGNPAGGKKGITLKATRIKNTIMSLFEENYLHTGKFMAWVRLPGNEEKFFDYMLKNGHVLPRDMNLNVTDEGDLAGKLKAARDRAAGSRINGGP